ncbi:MAG: glycosyltransferase [Paraprevotella sp.]|nr:glycosyltransferase [Paraprevotella sp.]
MIQVVFAIDREFVHSCAVTVLSILKNNVSADLMFHVVGDGLEDRDKRFLENVVKRYGSHVAFYTVQEDKLRGYEVRWGRNRLSKVVFYRCLLASVLPEQISKILYLDCDLLVLVPLDELWAVDLEGKALAAVPDAYTVNAEHCRRLDYDISDDYFNGGVLLLNLDYWRRYGLEQQCKSYYLNHADKLLYNDQDLLNGFLHGSRVLLDMKWNVQEVAYRLPKNKPSGWLPSYVETIVHPAILHYSGRKPWLYHCMHPLRHLYFEYESQLPGIKGKNDGWAEHGLRFIHCLPYILGWKRKKYVNVSYGGPDKRQYETENCPLISIIVPMYNVESYVEKCIRSLRDQTYDHIEVIVVDDASTDHSYDQCKFAIGEDPRFKLIRNSVNRGISAARNQGLSIAKGDFLGFVDSDDWIECGMYRNLYDAYLCSGADIVQCGYYLHLQDGNVKECTLGKNECFDTRTALELWFQDRVIKGYAWNKLYKRTLFDGITFPMDRTFEDILTLSEVFKRANMVYLIGYMGYHYAERRESIVNRAFMQNQWRIIYMHWTLSMPMRKPWDFGKIPIVF